MARDSKTKYAILGLLERQPMSGYDIKKAVETGLSNFWSESYGQIYPVVKQLADEGLATRIIQENEGKPDRHVYSITDAGRRALTDWLAEPAEPHKERVEVLLKVFFGRSLPVSEVIKHVERFQREKLEMMEMYCGMERHLMAEHSNNPNFPYWIMTLRCGLHVTRAILNWCDETLLMLDDMETINENTCS